MPDAPQGSEREQRLAARAAARTAGGANDRDPRAASAAAAVANQCEQLASLLRAQGWSNVTAKTAGRSFVLAGIDPTGKPRSGGGDNGRALVDQLVAMGGSGAPVDEPPPSPPPPAEIYTQMLIVDGTTYVVTPADALKLSGAFLLALNGDDTAVLLESGQTLTVTAANATDIAQQLAGGPA